MATAINLSAGAVLGGSFVHLAHVNDADLAPIDACRAACRTCNGECVIRGEEIHQHDVECSGCDGTGLSGEPGLYSFLRSFFDVEAV